MICFPTNWLSEKSPSPSWMARAAENGVYLIAANRYGLERGVQFSGGRRSSTRTGALQSVLDGGTASSGAGSTRPGARQAASPPRPKTSSPIAGRTPTAR